MSWLESLLPGEATAWMRAVEATSAPRWMLAWGILRSLNDPQHIPADKLPILAWAMSVDIWDQNWPIEKKRAVVAAAIADHRIKGTKAGIARHLAIVGAELLQAVTPPQRIFAAPTMGKEEYDAWLERMPQLRIYLRNLPGVGTGLAFYGRAFVGHDFAAPDRGAALYGRRPVLYDQGETIELRQAEVIESAATKATARVERYVVNGIGGPSFVGRDFFGRLFIGSAARTPQVYTVRIDGSYIHADSVLSLNTATPGLTPIDVRSRRKSELGVRGAGMFVGGFIRHGYFVRDDARFKIYDVIYLLDPARASPLVRSLSFYNHARFSMPPFTAEMLVKAPTRLRRLQAHEGAFYRRMFLAREDRTVTRQSLDAVVTAKALRDKALVSFETTRARTWGDGLPIDGSTPLLSRLPTSL